MSGIICSTMLFNYYMKNIPDLLGNNDPMLINYISTLKSSNTLDLN